MATNQVLEKGRKWTWTEKCEKAFSETKRMISSDQVLTHHDPLLPIQLECNASPYGIGAVLSHVMADGTDRPIGFVSRPLTSAERNYAQLDKEALALICGMKKFHSYLHGRHFTFVTDHQPLLSILSPSKGVSTMTSARLQRYTLFLSGMDYEIKFRNTSRHANAHALLRLPMQETCQQDEVINPVEAVHISQVDAIQQSMDWRKMCADFQTVSARNEMGILSKGGNWQMSSWHTEMPHTPQPIKRPQIYFAEKIFVLD